MSSAEGVLSKIPINTYQWFLDNLWQIIINVIGGALTAACAAVWMILKKKFSKRDFKLIFGSDIEDSGFQLVFGEFVLRENLQYPYDKSVSVPGFTGYKFSMEHPISSCEVRGANYLASIIGREMNITPNLSTDVSIRGKLNFSFIALGSPASNHKTNDVLINAANKLVDFKNNQFILKSTGVPIELSESGFDYGMILKISPEQFPRRTWITCFGIGEWGTSGAAWYLANKWREILKFAGSDSFAIIVKARQEQDEFVMPVFKHKF